MSSKIFKSKILLLLNAFSAGASQAWFCAAAQVIVPDVLPDLEAAVVAGHLADAVRNAGLVRSVIPPVVFPTASMLLYLDTVCWTQSCKPWILPSLTSGSCIGATKTEKEKQES